LVIIIAPIKKHYMSNLAPAFSLSNAILIEKILAFHFTFASSSSIVSICCYSYTFPHFPVFTTENNQPLTEP